MKPYKKGAHARKHIPYKRGKHSQGSTTIISTATFKYTLRNNPSMLVFGKSGIGKTSTVREFSLITGIPFFDEQNQGDPECINTLYEILHGREV